MSKLLCFDIDGTFIVADGCFSESAQYALRQAAGAVYKLVSPKTISEMQKEIGDYYFILMFCHKNADLSCREVIQRD